MEALPAQVFPKGLILAPRRGVWTGQQRSPWVPAIAILGDTVVGVGAGETLRTRLPEAPTLNVGSFATPGFRDSHLHFLGFAAAMDRIDCSSAVAGDIPELCRLIAARARTTPPGTWLRAGGYEHRLLRERRHPTRWELDHAAPRHPVVLRHRSGHAIVLNSAALNALGLLQDPPLLSAGYFEQDRERLTGLVIDGEQTLRSRGLPLRTPIDLARAAASASRRLTLAGVTWFCDMGQANDTDTLETLSTLASSGRMLQRWSAFSGLAAFRNDPSSRARFLGVKLSVSTAQGTPSPTDGELAELIKSIHQAGCSAAVHATDEHSLAVAVSAFQAVRRATGANLHRHRVEHAFVAPPALVKSLASLGLTVVTQPGFIFEHGDRYLETPDLRSGWLLPIRCMLDAGVRVVAGSDAPAGPVEPLQAVRAATTRRTAGGVRLAADQAVSLDAALRMWTTCAGYVGGGPAALLPGAPAEAVVIEAEGADPNAWEVRATIIGGRLFHDTEIGI